jgi:hypothetical protein
MTLEEKFWPNVRITPGCWVWDGALSEKGYGQLWLDNKIRLAHRISYQMHQGEEAGKLFVCHRCDNPKCVNPEHLFLGTAKDNALDMHRKGRANIPSRAGENHWSKRLIDSRAAGERNGLAKLTEKDVRGIVAEYEAGGTSQRKMAEKYGLHENTIFKLVNKRLWAHLWR